MASKRISKAHCDEEWCPIEVSIEVLGGMWKVLILRELAAGTKRYSELHRALKSVTHKMLAQQLRELEQDGVLNRKVYPVVPPKVEYSLTPLGTELDPILKAMEVWGKKVDGHRRKQELFKPPQASSPSPF